MSGVVRKKIQKHKASFTSVNNQSILVGAFWGKTERALVSWWLLTVLNVNKTMWSP
jgi:hypothetical protein